MRRRVVTAVIAVLVAVLPSLAATTHAEAAAAPLPVPYDFLTSAVPAGLTPDADPPGANDWTCRPSAKHPVPVVLVHGLTGNKATNWQTYAPLLKNNGYCVYALTYGQSSLAPAPFRNTFGGFTAMESSAAQLKAFVARVLKQTRATKIDILGHSEGTVMPDYYAKFLGGARYIDRYISIAPIWHGTNPAGLATLYQLARAFGFQGTVDSLFGSAFASGPELLAGSRFMAKLRSGGTPAVPGIRYTNIVTRYDELVLPYTSGIQAGMTNYRVQDYCPTDFSEHFEAVADPVAAQLVLNTLDPAHPKPVPCRVVLPFVGS